MVEHSEPSRLSSSLQDRVSPVAGYVDLTLASPKEAMCFLTRDPEKMKSGPEECNAVLILKEWVVLVRKISRGGHDNLVGV